jgi:hypothetical protein
MTQNTSLDKDRDESDDPLWHRVAEVISSSQLLGADVRFADIEEATYPIWVGRVSSVTFGLSSVGPLPTLMMIQALRTVSRGGGRLFWAGSPRVGPFGR